MKEEAPGHILTNADAWVFNDPVVFWSVFTVVFAFCMVIFALRKAMKFAEQERKDKESKGGNS